MLLLLLLFLHLHVQLLFDLDESSLYIILLLLLEHRILLLLLYLILHYTSLQLPLLVISLLDSVSHSVHEASDLVLSGFPFLLSLEFLLFHQLVVLLYGLVLSIPLSLLLILQFNLSLLILMNDFECLLAFKSALIQLGLFLFIDLALEAVDQLKFLVTLLLGIYLFLLFGFD